MGDEVLPPRVRHARADLLRAFERLAAAVTPALPDGARPVDMFHNPRYIVLHAPGERCHGMWYEVAELPRLPLPERPGAITATFTSTGRYETRDDGCWAEIYEVTEVTHG